jgi:hypothetical protein
MIVAPSFIFSDWRQAVYILVQHTVSDPATVWSRAQQTASSLPAHLKLHHSFPTPDGRRATCIWEAESIDTLKAHLDPALGPGATNEYFEAVNKEGIALPTSLVVA